MFKLCNNTGRHTFNNLWKLRIKYLREKGCLAIRNIKEKCITDADLSSLLHYAHVPCYKFNVLTIRWLYGCVHMSLLFFKIKPEIMYTIWLYKEEYTRQVSNVFIIFFQPLSNFSENCLLVTWITNFQVISPTRSNHWRKMWKIAINRPFFFSHYWTCPRIGHL